MIDHTKAMQELQNFEEKLTPAVLELINFSDAARMSATAHMQEAVQSLGHVPESNYNP